MKSTFIRAIEVWVPSPDGANIDLEDGIYHDLDYFAAISRGMRFAAGEGLPGRTWQAGRPIVLKDLANSYFQRGEAAAHVGLTCAVAVPSFAGEDLRSVTVFFCGDDNYRVGALEVWEKPERELELALADGYFGRAETFEFSSRHTVFPCGMGLPGTVWKEQRPVVWEDLGRGNIFLRRDAAEKVGINRGVGIPVNVRPGSGPDHGGQGAGDDAPTCVLTFLSARNSPIAGRFEVWRRTPDGEGFAFETGYCESDPGFSLAYADVTISFEDAAIGRAARTQVPVIVRDLSVTGAPYAASACAAGNRSALMLPNLNGTGSVETVLAIYV